MMTLRGLTTVVVLLSATTQAHAQEWKVLAQTDHTLTLQFRCEKPDLREKVIAGQRYARVRVTGFHSLSETGKPELPAASYTLSVPSGPVTFRVLEATEDRITIAPLALFQEQPFDGTAQEARATEADEAFYTQDTYYPPNVAAFRELGSLRGSRLVSLDVFPYRYNPKRSELLVHKRIVIELEFTKPMQSAVPSVSPKVEQQLLENVTPHMASPPAVGPSSTRPVAKMTESSQPRVKLLVDADGLYHITYEALRDSGADLRSVDPRTLRLINKGREVPVYVKGADDGRFDAGDYFEFWGEFNKKTFQHLADDLYRDPYSDVNVYWLSWDGAPGLRLAEEKGLLIETDPSKYIAPFSYPFTVHAEQDRSFDRLSQVPPDSLRDHWFWGAVSTNEKSEFTVELSHPDAESDRMAHFTAMLHGRTYPSPEQLGNPAHVIDVFVNSLKVATGVGIGQRKMVLHDDPAKGIPPKTLLHGENVITVINNSDPATLDNVLVNWFEITYPRLYRADDDFMQFSIPEDGRLGLYQFSLDGFTEPTVEIYKLGISKIVGAAVEQIEEPLRKTKFWRVMLQDEVYSPDVQYVALTPSQKKQPLRIIPWKSANLRDPSNGADYIIITHEQFFEDKSLRQLAEHRESQGRRVKVVKVQDVYDEFAEGLVTPDAIKEFLRYTYRYWTPPAPLYVLLVGDGTWDTRGATRNGGNPIPVYLYQTLKWGATASDHWYALVDGDDQIPDLFVGRLPVRTPEELKVVVEKILAYDRESPTDGWRNRILFLGGDGSIFREQSEQLIRENVPKEYEPRRLYTTRDPNLNPDPYLGGTYDLVRHLNEGVAVVNFIGHGGGAIWADNALFRLEDVQRLNNVKRYPIVTSMTCFTGAFDEPYRRPLAEEFLKSEEKGAVAVWGSSGLGWLWNDFYIVREFFEALLQAPGKTLGQAMAEAKIRYLGKYFNPQVFSMVNQYNLLGDPALVPIFPKEQTQLRLSSVIPQPGETVTVLGQVPFAEGTGDAVLLDGQVQEIAREAVQVRQGEFEARFRIPPDLKTSEGVVRAYVASPDGRTAHGAADFTLEGTRVEEVATVPAKPTSRDSVRFRARFLNVRGVVSAQCVVTSAGTDTLPMAPADSRGTFETVKAVAPRPPGSTILYWFVTTTRDGKSLSSPRYTLIIPRGLDLSVSNRDIALAGERYVRVEAMVRNFGDESGARVPVQFSEWNATAQTWQVIGVDTVTVESEGQAIASVPAQFRSLTPRIRVEVDPANTLSELTKANNQAEASLVLDRFNVTEALGSTVGNAANDTITFGDNLWCLIPPHAVQNNGVLQVARMENPMIHQQPDLHFVLPVNESKPTGYTLRFASAEDSLAAGSWITIALAMGRPDSTGAPIGIYWLDPRTRKWVRMESRVENRWVVAQVNRLGAFVVATSVDTKPPRIEATVEGQLFTQGGYAPREPVITALLQDENGIDLSPGRVTVLVDGQPASPSVLMIPDTVADGNSVPISLRQTFAPGPHGVAFRAADCNGNWSEIAEVNFQVAASFDLHALGNYPNPFRFETTFAYELTDRAQDFSIKIYTASGRLIRVIRPHDILEDPNPTDANYHEARWDGTDEDGNEVANGVYFYKITAVLGDKTVEKTGKMAKIR